jgi:hypothetical protein
MVYIDVVEFEVLIVIGVKVLYSNPELLILLFNWT